MQATTAQPEQLESAALTWKEQAVSITVADQDSYDRACEMLRGIKQLRDEAEAHHRPVINSIYKSHKEALGALQRIDAPLCDAERILKFAVGNYEIAQRRAQEEAERAARETAEREQAQLLEQQIEQAEASGATQQEVAAIIEQPVPLARPMVPQTHIAAKGISARETYSAEVTDLKSLCREIAEGRQPATLVVPNATALNGLARSLRTALNIPGVRVVVQSSTSVRSR